jgi:hypothetical protein
MGVGEFIYGKIPRRRVQPKPGHQFRLGLVVIEFQVRVQPDHAVGVLLEEGRGDGLVVTMVDGCTLLLGDVGSHRKVRLQVGKTPSHVPGSSGLVSWDVLEHSILRTAFREPRKVLHG